MNNAKNKKWYHGTHSWVFHVLYTLAVPAVFIFTTEWIHRGSLSVEFFSKNFFPCFEGYFLAWLFLVCLYIAVSHIFRCHTVGVFITAVISNVPGVVTYYKLNMRGEPFLPWDLTQLNDLAGVSDKISLQIQPAMVWSVLIFLLIFAASFLVHFPYKGIWWRLGGFGGGTVLLLTLIFGVYLQPAVTQSLAIYPDYWMQDRYYRNYGVITGFMTNLQALQIDKPEAYSEEAITALETEITEAAKNEKPLYETSYAATQESTVKQPNIIYVMNESFYDVSRLEGITYSEELTPNLTALKEQAAYGYCYSPSFGGGTCDVEFEALTGFSMSHLPAGVKPYQQHVTQDMFSLPQYLKSTGYQTLAIHGYYARFWSRNVAYPYLGIDEYIAREQFTEPELRRGFVSDAEMTRRIISEYEAREADGPLFIHAVTMQNHTTYSEDRYVADELVQITDYPAGMSENTLSQLRDFATGVKEADAALGDLIAYFSTVDEPTIIVFWGDHMNPIGSACNSFELFESTGYIEKGSSTSPALHKTDLLVWSNYAENKVELGTVAAYDISAVMMDLYGLDKPLMFTFLTQELHTMRARTLGITINPDESISEEMTEQQQAYFDQHALLQYDFMFGAHYLPDYTPPENDT